MNEKQWGDGSLEWEVEYLLRACAGANADNGSGINAGAYRSGAQK